MQGSSCGLVPTILGDPVRFSYASPLAIALLLVGCSDFGSRVPAGITVPEGFSVEVAAGPPLVQRPMIVDMDDEGRLYVAESSGSNDDVRTQLSEKPHSILQLQDLDGDGKYDRRTVFADRMMLPEGVLWHEGSVYVAAPPIIWKLTDVDGDGVADRREEWFDGKTLTNCANDLHGPYLGLDGRIYWTKGAFAEQTYERPGREPLVTRAAHIFRRRVDGGPVEVVLTGGMDNPVEVAFAPDGERFLTSTFLHHPQLGKRDGIVHAVYGGVYGKAHSVTDGHPMTGGLLPVMTDMGSAATVGLARYASSVFGEDYQGRLFATAFNLRKVTSHRLVPEGATFRTEDSDFLVSESRDFHPTDVMEDADGSLLVVDTGAWYKLCCPTSQMEKPDALGAIYRVRRSGASPPPDPRGSQIDWGGLTAAGLADLLDDQRPAVRDRAVRELEKAGDLAALDEVLSSGSEVARLNAVWALTRIGTEGARATVRAGLSDSSAAVRLATLHSVALHRDSGAFEATAGLLSDQAAGVRRGAAEALGRIGDSRAVGPLLDATSDSLDDEMLTHSLIYALIEIADPRATAAGLDGRSAATERAAMIALDQMRSQALTGRRVLTRLESPEPSVAEAARWIAGRHPEWGGLLAGYLRNRLQTAGREASAEVVGLLKRFAADPTVQDLLASAAAGAREEASKTALEAMAAASLETAPPSWPDAVAAALAREETRAEALRAARRIPRGDSGHPQLDRALISVARDPSVDASVRILALDAGAAAVSSLDAELYALAAGEVLASRPVNLRAAAARVLSLVPLDRSQLLGLADLLPEVGPMELPELVEAFAQSADRDVGVRLVARLRKAPGLANLRADIADRATAGYDSTVRDELDGLLIGEVAGLEDQRNKLEELLVELEPGDAKRGQAVFNSTEGACLACHAIGFAGGQVGPGLTTIGQIRDRRDLLEAIVFPSASFVRSYEPIVAVAGERSVSGVVVEESDSHLLIAVNADERVQLARADIDEIRPGTVSVMPSGLDAQLSDRELADLLKFLEATQWGPVGRGW
ncbi:MAG: HEAT repeat domain-containing protein [Bryobacterales bacterium]|nr:HEAT repeat domain-containing protein [Bryobacterales bacterium]